MFRDLSAMWAGFLPIQVGQDKIFYDLRVYFLWLLHQAQPRLLTLWRFLHFSFMHFLDLRSRKALTVLAFIQNSSKNLHEFLPPKKAQSQQPRRSPRLYFQLSTLNSQLSTS
jgi:hypothetical protein